jgi:membrane-bound serine protease (ClpP class)
VFLVRLAVRARRMKSRLGLDALVGLPASAMEPLTPDGHVLVDGEIWRAVADQAVAEGTALRVTGREQFLLHVTPLEPPHNAV